MKTFALILMLASNMALAAGLECKNGVDELNIQFVPENKVTVQLRGFQDGGHAPVNLFQFTGEKIENSSSGISLFEKTSYALLGVTTDLQTVDGKLTIIKRPYIGRGGCGRGLCDTHQYYATLEYDQDETSYDCKQTF